MFAGNPTKNSGESWATVEGRKSAEARKQRDRALREFLRAQRIVDRIDRKKEP